MPKNCQIQVSSNWGYLHRMFYVLSAFIFLGLTVISFHNFLLFHCLAEIFSVIIAFTIFVVAWNTRHITDSSYLLFLGIAYFFIGLLDLTHTLAYKGMNIFPSDSANLPTQLWIASRYLEAGSLALAPLFLTRPLKPHQTLLTYAGICALILLSLFVWPVFPDCFLPQTGLTDFKIVSEYIIVLILAGAMILITLRRNCLMQSTFRLLIIAMALSIAQEIAFTFYVDVYGLSNLAGHLCKIVSFYCVYRAILVSALTRPYQTLFRELAESENARGEQIKQLEEALEKIKTLHGIIPICGVCKKIRNDEGAWDRLEAYFSKNSDAQFSHGLCPDCARKQAEEMGWDPDEFDER